MTQACGLTLWHSPHNVNIHNIHAYYIITDPLLWYHLTFPPGRVTWPLLGWERERGGGQNASMKTTWRVERAATKQGERERERGQYEPQRQTEKNKRAAVGKIQVSRTKVRSRTRGYTRQPESGPQTRSCPVHHVRVHQKKKLEQTAAAEPHQVRETCF